MAYSRSSLSSIDRQVNAQRRIEESFRKSALAELEQLTTQLAYMQHGLDYYAGRCGALQKEFEALQDELYLALENAAKMHEELAATLAHIFSPDNYTPYRDKATPYIKDLEETVIKLRFEFRELTRKLSTPVPTITTSPVISADDKGIPPVYTANTSATAKQPGFFKKHWRTMLKWTLITATFAAAGILTGFTVHGMLALSLLAKAAITAAASVYSGLAASMVSQLCERKTPDEPRDIARTAYAQSTTAAIFTATKGVVPHASIRNMRNAMNAMREADAAAQKAAATAPLAVNDVISPAPSALPDVQNHDTQAALILSASLR